MLQARGGDSAGGGQEGAGDAAEAAAGGDPAERPAQEAGAEHDDGRGE